MSHMKEAMSFQLPSFTYSVRMPSAVSLPSGVSQDTRTVNLLGSAMRSFTLGHLILGGSISENITRTFSQSSRNTSATWGSTRSLWHAQSSRYSVFLKAVLTHSVFLFPPFILPLLSCWVLKIVWVLTCAWLNLQSIGLARCLVG